MSRPKLFIAIHYMHLGGAEISLIGLLQALDPDRVDVDLFVYSHEGELMKLIPEYVNLLPENADPRDFGFNIQGSLRDHWMRIIARDVALWGPHKENYYYKVAAERMRANYDTIDDKEFVDWFLKCDFNSMKKRALRTYYVKNFWAILKHKVRI